MKNANLLRNIQGTLLKKSFVMLSVRLAHIWGSGLSRENEIITPVALLGCLLSTATVAGLYPIMSIPTGISETKTDSHSIHFIKTAETCLIHSPIILAQIYIFPHIPTEIAGIQRQCLKCLTHHLKETNWYRLVFWEVTTQIERFICKNKRGVFNY